MVSKLPEGFATVTPFLAVKDAAKAIELYKKAFGAVEESRLTGPDGKIGHACLTIGNSKVFMAEENPGMCSYAPNENGSSVGFYLYVTDADAAYKKARDVGMQDIMPPQDMFWGDRMGAVRDSFGYKWNLATKVKDMTSDEIKKASAEFFQKIAASKASAA